MKYAYNLAKTVEKENENWGGRRGLKPHSLLEASLCRGKRTDDDDGVSMERSDAKCDIVSPRLTSPPWQRTGRCRRGLTALTQSFRGSRRGADVIRSQRLSQTDQTDNDSICTETRHRCSLKKLEMTPTSREECGDASDLQIVCDRRQTHAEIMAPDSCCKRIRDVLLIFGMYQVFLSSAVDVWWSLGARRFDVWKNSQLYLLGTQPICNKLKMLSPGQIRFCQLYQDHMPSVSRGAELGILECQWQFRNHRWNCTSAGDNTSAFGVVPHIGEL
ncbi:hypothetical protein LSAT2_013232 [Lamellibrachia satsuma]|nr:hypothetical protein LSAT2_013232 [Lamellibrachia satsuma]